MDIKEHCKFPYEKPLLQMYSVPFLNLLASLSIDGGFDEYAFEGEDATNGWGEEWSVN